MTTLDRLLSEPGSRMITLTGPPGVGKTRLAIAVAAAAAPRFRHGVAFVDLTDVREAPLVVPAVLAVTGTAEVAGPEAADRDMLLVVDNFEHLLDAGPALAAAVAGCTGLTLLMTSRERLHLWAEREVPVRPLALPRDDDADGSAAAPAVEMLVQCVRRFDPGFDVTPDNRAALGEICSRLDGLPLALELAAARLKLFTPGELTFRLRHRMGILINTVLDVPERHRTLRAALAWSHDLLKPDERKAFRRLSVFVGGATLDAAGQVCDLDDPVDTVASLVDKSLLHRRVRPDGVTEFLMLESLREYAAELLVEHGEEEVVNARHARYFADLAVLGETAVEGTARAAWVDGARFDQGNLRKALASLRMVDTPETAGGPGDSARHPGPGDPPTTSRRLSSVPRVAGRRDGEPRPVRALTVRERQVARLVAGGSTNRQIGQALGIAEKTTEAHVHNIIRKLGAQNRAEVAARVSSERSG